MYQVEFYDRDGRLDHNATVRDLNELIEVAGGRQMRIVGKATMSTDEAMILIRDYGDTLGVQGTLEILQHMQGNICVLNRHQRHAYDVLMNGFHKMFFGDDGEEEIY